MTTNTYISIITLNANGLNPENKNRLAEWLKKQDPSICCLQETHFSCKDTNKTESKGMEKDSSCKWKPKQSWSSLSYI